MTKSKNLTNNAQRSHMLKEMAQSQDWRLVQDVTMKMLDGSSLYTIASQARAYENFIFGDHWQYAEIEFEASGPMTLTAKRPKILRYVIMSVTLPRKLPNVVFDSIKHQKRQFRVAFDSKQYVQLEGNFNKYFATYFASDYVVDSLSFITPEVMEALIAADDYDIEIIHDRLLLFGPIRPDSLTQIKQMAALITLVREKLLNNILTYRDDRLPYNDGRKIVARAGFFLAKPAFGWRGYIALTIYLLKITAITIIGLAILLCVIAAVYIVHYEITG